MNIEPKILKKFKKTYGELQGVSLIGNVWHSFDAGRSYESCIIVYCDASMNCALLPTSYEGYAVIIQSTEVL